MGGGFRSMLTDRRAIIISDVHANADALRAVFEDASRAFSFRGDSDFEVFCAGDVVGYGPEPNEVIKMLMDRNTISVGGNHDHVVVGKWPDDTMWHLAADAARLTKQMITGQSHEWLSNQKDMEIIKHSSHDHNSVTIVHGSIDNPQSTYVTDKFHDANAFESMITNRLSRNFICGHTHKYRVSRGKYDYEATIQNGWPCFDMSSFEDISNMDSFWVPSDMVNEFYYSINPGSVGQPRDGDSRASYLTMREGVDGSFLFSRRLVEYDVDAVAGKIVAAGLPRFMADRLYEGR